MATSQQYTPPSLCIGDWTIANDCTNNADANTIESYVAESIEIAGAPIQVFKLLGVHEQGKLVDLTGQGAAISSGAASGSDATAAFDISASSWISAQQGDAVSLAPAFIGYNFGTKKQLSGVEKYAPSAPIIQHITTIKIQQGPLHQNRVAQVRIDRANGNLKASSVFSGNGDGLLNSIAPGYAARPTMIMVTALSPTEFSVASTVTGSGPNAVVGQSYSSSEVNFTIHRGQIPFSIGDSFIIKLELDWKRSDVVNLPDTGALETISIKPSSPASYWRIVPLMFNGGATDAWEVVKIEMLDYQATSINNIQDTLFLENRDRDYSTNSIQLKCQYQPFDAVGDVGKWGFSILDQYVFTCSFARMVELLGRPIVIGDILEVTPELQYDQNLMPVKKFLEVSDAGWSAEGYTPTWKPVLYRFQAIAILASQENRDILKSPEDALYKVDDGNFFENIQQVQTSPILVTETIEAEAQNAVPETGSDATSIQSGMPQIPNPPSSNPHGQYDGQDQYIEDGLPPNGLPYTEGFALPDINTAHDGDYFRLNYAAHMGIAPRLYKFSLVKNSWIYIETDRRHKYSSHKPSVRNALLSNNRKSIKDTL